MTRTAFSGRSVARTADLPKAELHIHLESSMRPGTVQDLAHSSGLPLPHTGPFPSLSAFIPEYEVARRLVRSPSDLTRLAEELVQDARSQGVVWSEVHLIPSSYAGRLGPAEVVVEAVLAGLGEAAGIILGINRALPLDAAQESLDLALRYIDQGVVGLGLAGDEARHDVRTFSAVFARAAHAGLPLIPHAGEGSGPQSVRACVELGAHRIQHGVRAVEDPDLVELLAERGVALDLCPASNVALGVVPSQEVHPLRVLLEARVPVTLSSDGQLFSGVSIEQEYDAARLAHRLTDEALAAIATTSIEASSCPEPARKTALAGIASWLHTASAGDTA